jgi:hypothetical protein
MDLPGTQVYKMKNRAIKAFFLTNFNMGGKK